MLIHIGACILIIYVYRVEHVVDKTKVPCIEKRTLNTYCSQREPDHIRVKFSETFNINHASAHAHKHTIKKKVKI